MQGWYGVDLDGTLAHYDKFEGPGVIGAPIPLMVDRVKNWLKEGKKVKIFTARVSHPDEAPIALEAIIKWCVQHIGQELEVTCYKDYGMIQLYDDRCVQVVPNNGVPITVPAYEEGYKAGYAAGYDNVTNGRED
jgi:hypothetical protein